MKIDRAIRSTRVVTPAGERPATVLVGDGKIVEVVEYDAFPTDVPLDDWGSLALLPGLVDTHVHCNEPGRTEWEGFETATKSAIAGGVTTIVDMPLNCSPVTTTAEAFRQKLAATESKLWCDVGFWGGVVPGNLADIDGLIEAGVLGFKAFLCDSGIDEFPAVSEGDLREAMTRIAKARLPLLAHCEIVSPMADVYDDPRKHSTWLASRPSSFEYSAVDMLVDLCAETGCRIHIVHLADPDCDDILTDYSHVGGLPLSVETCPHYLSFVAENIPDGATEYKCAPPIRSRESGDQLWKMLFSRTIDMVASDHSPCPPAMKCRESGNFLEAWGGIASLQLGVSIIWTEAVSRGGMIENLARWMSEKPAELAQLTKRKGSLLSGCDADITVFEPDKNWTVDATQLFHRHKITPYDGERLHGLVAATYLHGELVYRDGTFVHNQPTGKTILRTA